MKASNVEKIYKKNKEKREKNKQEGLLELRRLLVEEDIVTGYYEDCIHKKFNKKVSFYPCPWDSRVQYGGTENVDCGCYYKCRKHEEKILSNKEVYIAAVDKLINNLDQNPKWGTEGKKRNPILNNEAQKQIREWDKKKEKEERLKYEKEKLYKEENEFKMVGCPTEFMQDLNELAELGFLDDLGDDFEFAGNKIIYRYVDEWFMDEYTEINTQNIIFSMYPNKEHTEMNLSIGNGTVVVHTIELTKYNKTALISFWSKWNKFKKENPDKYTYEKYESTSAGLAEEKFQKLIEGMTIGELEELLVGDALDDLWDLNKGAKFLQQDITREKNIFDFCLCEACIFNDQCDRVFCLKDSTI